MSRFLVFAGMLVCMMNACAMDVDKLPPLHRAVWDGDCAEIERLLSEGAQVNELDGNRWNMGLSPLHCAVRNAQIQAASLLLGRGAEVDCLGECRSFISPMKRPRRGSYLSDPDQLEAYNSKNVRPLHFAAGLPNTNIAELLLKHGAQIKCPTDTESPLHVAADKGTLTMIRLLHNHGADLEATDQWGRRPLHLAAISTEERPENIDELLRCGATMPANVMEWSNYKGEKYVSPYTLIWRGFKLRRDKNKYGVSYSPNVFLDASLTFAHLCARDLLHISKRISECSQRIEELGKQDAITPSDDRRALFAINLASTQYNAALAPLCEQARSLIDKGAYLNPWDLDGNFPLHYLIDTYNEFAPTLLDELAWHILRAGARVNVLNKAGQSPLSIAQGRGNRHMISCLLSHAFKEAVSAGGDTTSAVCDIIVSCQYPAPIAGSRVIV